MLYANNNSVHPCMPCIQPYLSAQIDPRPTRRWTLPDGTVVFPGKMEDHNCILAEERQAEIKLSSTGAIRYSSIQHTFSHSSYLKSHDWFILASPYGKKPKGGSAWLHFVY